MYCCILLYHSISVLTLHLLTAFSSVNSFGFLRILKFWMNFIFFYCLQTLNDNIVFRILEPVSGFIIYLLRIP